MRDANAMSVGKTQGEYHPENSTLAIHRGFTASNFQEFGKQPKADI